jgi:hypothetical protein
MSGCKTFPGVVLFLVVAIGVISCSLSKTTIHITPPQTITPTNIITPRKTVGYDTISSTNIRILLNKWNIKPRMLEISDDDYIALPKSHVDAYVKGYIGFATLNGLYPGRKQKNDCDDFARAFSFYFRASANRNTNFASNIAVADIYYCNTNESHAVNLIIVVSTNYQYEPIFVDPGKAIVGATNKFGFPTNWNKDIYFLNM